MDDASFMKTTIRGALLVSILLTFWAVAPAAFGAPPDAAKPSAKRTKESKVARKAKAKAPAAVPDLAAEAPAPSAGENPGEDVMRQLRRAEPTL